MMKSMEIKVGDCYLKKVKTMNNACSEPATINFEI